MQELIKAGYAHRQAPLWLKQARASAHREDPNWRSCSRQVDKIGIFDRHGTQFKLTETRWQRFALSSSTRVVLLRAAHSHDVVQF
jgi:hypothetical protein